MISCGTPYVKSFHLDFNFLLSCRPKREKSIKELKVTGEVIVVTCKVESCKFAHTGLKTG